MLITSTEGEFFCSSVDEVLKRAHVPPRHGVYIERKEMIEEIRKQLYKLKDEDGYDLHAHSNLGHHVSV